MVSCQYDVCVTRQHSCKEDELMIEANVDDANCGNSENPCDFIVSCCKIVKVLSPQGISLTNI